MGNVVFILLSAHAKLFVSDHHPSRSQLLTEADEMQRELEQLQKADQLAQERYKECKKQCADLEKAIKESESERGNKAKEIEKGIALCKKKLSEGAQQMKEYTQGLEKLNLELQELEEEAKGVEEQV